MSTDISLQKYLQNYAEYHQTAENLYPVGMSGATMGLGDILHQEKIDFIYWHLA